MPAPTPEPTEMDLGAALAELDVVNPRATSVVRAFLARLQQDGPLQHLLQVAVDPVWRSAVDVVADFNLLKGREIAAVEKQTEATQDLAKAYADRTALWKDVVLPKVMPAVGILLIVLVTWIAMMLGVSLPAGTGAGS